MVADHRSESQLKKHILLLNYNASIFTVAIKQINLRKVSAGLDKCDPSDRNESHVGKLHFWENSKM